ncbi:SigE family RNA polymerase sigma factor [Pseudonocardia sp.]|uniref:SigE family RNA polymerase sigma factor n=1 Tax=Pseudonocardia sp. TaxID=60912 RepID=UPI00262320E1|nr:SigE family RNA polymerase sigma factor [Pseudonocardia sp.]
MAGSEGREAGFDAFYAATSGRVLGQLYVLTGDRATAEDAVAEAYTRAWQRWALVSAHDAPEAWVRTVASRVAISAWRKARNRLLAHRRAAPAPVDPTRHRADLVALAAALRGIPERQRRAVVLHHLADLPVAEVAREMDVPEGTVKSWLSRARRDLVTALAEPGAAVGHGTLGAERGGT